jgi:hypothetical protein
MNDTALKSATQDIVVDEVFPHAPETIWKTLTTGALIARWLMEPRGFAPVQGTRLKLVHSGFVTPINDSAFQNMSDGWRKVVPTLGNFANGPH